MLDGGLGGQRLASETDGVDAPGGGDEGKGAKKQLHPRIDRGALNTQTEGRLDRQSDGWKMDDGGHFFYLCEIVVTGSAPVFW